MAINYPNNTIHQIVTPAQISKALGREINNDAYANTCALRIMLLDTVKGVQLQSTIRKVVQLLVMMERIIGYMLKI